MARRTSRSPLIGIAAAEQETGLSKHTLRAWESRYGFPKPARDGSGERLYAEEQIAKLKLVARLIKRGHRPGNILTVPMERLTRMAGALPQEAPKIPKALDIDIFLDQLSAGSTVEFQRALQANLVRYGLRQFVLGTVEPLMEKVGVAWACGKIQTYQEHLFTEQVDRTMRQAMSSLIAAAPPMVLLTTFPDEQHGMGLLMLEALLRLEGATCIPLGVQTPLKQIAKFATDAKVDIVGLSFSAAYKDSALIEKLSMLRRDLAPGTAIWCGGAGARIIGRRVRGVRVLRTLEDGVGALHAWRQARESRSPSP
jgi:methanogenic corrinoid protein MtbC1